MSKFAKKLAEFLRIKKNSFSEVETHYDGYCETCYSEWHEVDIDEDKLQKEIDEFIATFKKESNEPI